MNLLNRLIWFQSHGLIVLVKRGPVRPVANHPNGEFQHRSHESHHFRHRITIQRLPLNRGKGPWGSQKLSF